MWLVRACDLAGHVVRVCDCCQGMWLSSGYVRVCDCCQSMSSGYMWLLSEYVVRVYVTVVRVCRQGICDCRQGMLSGYMWLLSGYVTVVRVCDCRQGMLSGYVTVVRDCCQRVSWGYVTVVRVSLCCQGMWLSSGTVVSVCHGGMWLSSGYYVVRVCDYCTVSQSRVQLVNNTWPWVPLFSPGRAQRVRGYRPQPHPALATS